MGIPTRQLNITNQHLIPPLSPAFSPHGKARRHHEKLMDQSRDWQKWKTSKVMQ
jgi:hypothetical protein